MSEDLRQLFPVAYEDHWRTHNHGPEDNSRFKGIRHSGPRPLSTRSRMILTLELRGFDQTQIARRLQLNPNAVWRITRTDRYRQFRDHHLERMDNELLAMKPLAFDALRGGLKSQDENTALRASEQWMKAAGFMHYGNRGAAQGGAPVTAEDVASQLLAQVNVQVNVTVPTPTPMQETEDGKDGGAQGTG